MALPYVGGYQVPVNRPPFFTPILHPMTPFFIQSTPNDPLFSTFCIKFYIKVANFCALRAHFEKFNDFCCNFNKKNCKFCLEIAFLHTEWPPFLRVHIRKAPIFLVPTPNDPFFRRNLTPNAPYFRSPVGTCTSLSYLSAPPPPPGHEALHFAFFFFFFCSRLQGYSKSLTRN